MLGAGIGIGRIGGSAAEGMARQPENSAKIQTAMIISAALIEGVALFVAVIALLMYKSLSNCRLMIADCRLGDSSRSAIAGRQSTMFPLF